MELVLPGEVAEGTPARRFLQAGLTRVYWPGCGCCWALGQGEGKVVRGGSSA